MNFDQILKAQQALIDKWILDWLKAHKERLKKLQTLTIRADKG